MALGSTQPLTETSTRIFPWSKVRPARKAGNLTLSVDMFWEGVFGGKGGVFLSICGIIHYIGSVRVYD
jgi:hypothetical protein